MKFDWKWVASMVLVGGGMVVGAAGGAAVLSYRVEQHEKAVTALTAQVNELTRSLQELTITLKVKGVVQ
jgi:hypothetical protein